MKQEIKLEELAFEIAHVGINAENEEEATGIAKLFGAMFGFAYRDAEKSIFMGTAIEVMKTPFLGKNGHIGIWTKDIQKAIEYVEDRGFGLDENTRNKDDQGNTLSIYFKDEVGGFAVHLLQKK